MLNRLREVGDRERREDADDRHNDQKLDEREAGLCASVAHILCF
jgi:hypothetical protein